jgi:peroxiredoxin
MIHLEEGFLEKVKTNKGNSLSQLSKDHPVLLIFLRHFGCIFCREAMSDISKIRGTIESRGVQIVFAHMADEPTAESYFNEMGLDGLEHISDPACKVYTAFGLVKGNFNQLYGLKVWIRGIETRVKDSTSFSLKQIGDGLQMPGVFFIMNDEIKQEFVHSRISDRPDYSELISCCA